MQGFPNKSFKPPPTKIKPSSFGSISKFLLTGLAYSIIDSASSRIFYNQNSNFDKYYQKYKQYREQRHYSDVIPQENKQQIDEENMKQQQQELKFRKKNLNTKILETIDSNDKNDKETDLKSKNTKSDGDNYDISNQNLRDTAFTNLIYGIIFSNLGSITQKKVHINLLKRQMSINWKFLLITPWAIIPYYYFMGMNDKLYVQDINEKIIHDFVPLLTIRAAGDYLLYCKIPMIQTKRTNPNMTNLEQLKLLGNSQKALLLGQKLLRGFYIFTMISLYNERVGPKTQN